ncbi:hypothetical protein CTI12_AA160010 [Artemisia annua]|uniref:Uncharacterized protein n=1 Tax=Artemisia annua TaxID=35608 RepID=A0A2U1PEE0_ARTAN|nr:hypothetical protein CTI12_AA160010 [Artemisia annua]
MEKQGQELRDQMFLRNSRSIEAGAAALILAIIWFVFFGLAIITHHYFGWRIDIKGKESLRSHMICLVLLIVFTLVVALHSSDTCKHHGVFSTSKNRQCGTILPSFRCERHH